MQSSNEEVAARKLAAEQRVAEHMAWKREFFQARPPPPSIGRLHRRQCGPKGGAPVHVTMKRAREVPPPPPIVRPPPSASPQPEAATMESSKHDSWVQQMSLERKRRSPFADLNINSDSRRTVIMANLHADTVEEDLRVFADQFGRVLQVRIVRHKETGKSRRYAFVEFGLPAEAGKAVAQSRRKRLRGRAIIIDMEKGRTVPGFLPKRLATAAQCEVQPQGEALAAPGETNATAVKAAVVEEDDDAFLNSLLNA